MIWNCGDKKIKYGTKTLIMGIVNVTPDSFSDGGKYNNVDTAVDYALQLVNDGADILDFGAQSTRPNYTEITAQEEWSRLKDILPAVRAKTGVPISIDTYFPLVAQNALNCGANIINDISGVITPKMAKIVKNTACGWIITHNGAGSVSQVGEFFKNSAKLIDDYGIDKSQICFDVGIGFGKNYQQDLALISNIGKCKMPNYPLMLGASRKRVIGKGSGQDNPQMRVYGNIAADTVAIFGGVDIIRLHDVKNEKQGVLMAQSLKSTMR